MKYFKIHKNKSLHASYQGSIEYTYDEMISNFGLPDVSDDLNVRTWHLSFCISKDLNVVSTISTKNTSPENSGDPTSWEISGIDQGSLFVVSDYIEINSALISKAS